MTKREIETPDGRYIIYYSFEDEEPETDDDAACPS